MSDNSNSTLNDTAKADAWIRDHRDCVKPRYRLDYHVMPPVGWMNDPNGLVYFKGQYHAFYQFYPYSSEWGPMHWGHAISDDMVHWKDAPVAMAPGSTADRDGCYSGSAVDDDGKLSLIYTGQIFDDGDIKPFNTEFSETQNLAVSEDGIHFSKYAQNPVIPAAPSDNSRNFRDPKVWKHDGRWYVVIGSSTKDNEARALLYSSADLREWKFESVIAHSEGKIGEMWECPDFFSLDGKDVLLFSPVGMEPEGLKYHNVFQTGYLVGDFDYASGKLQHGEFEEVDRGHDFYASQTFEAADGRRICMAWMNMWQTPMPEQADGWAGAMTVPRELHAVDGQVRMTPIKELESLRGPVIADVAAPLSNDQVLAAPKENRCEVLFSADVPADGNSKIGVSLDIGTDHDVSFTYDAALGRLTLDRGGEDGVRAYDCGKLEKLDLHIYIDRSSMEVFVNDGLATFTSRMYPATAATIKAVAPASGLNGKVRVYALNAMR